jgi:hypothetical protein
MNNLSQDALILGGPFRDHFAQVDSVRIGDLHDCPEGQPAPLTPTENYLENYGNGMNNVFGRGFCHHRKLPSKGKELNRVFCTTIALVLTFHLTSALGASSLDGEWTGQFQCGEVLNGNGGEASLDLPIALTVSGEAANGTLTTARGKESLTGAILGGDSLNVRFEEKNPNQKGQHRTFAFQGVFSERQFSGKGGIYGPSGKQLRECTLALSLPPPVPTGRPLSASGMDEVSQTTVPSPKQSSADTSTQQKIPDSMRKEEPPKINNKQAGESTENPRGFFPRHIEDLGDFLVKAGGAGLLLIAALLPKRDGRFKNGFKNNAEIPRWVKMIGMSRSLSDLRGQKNITN